MDAAWDGDENKGSSLAAAAVEQMSKLVLDLVLMLNA